MRKVSDGTDHFKSGSYIVKCSYNRSYRCSEIFFIQCNQKYRYGKYNNIRQEVYVYAAKHPMLDRLSFEFKYLHAPRMNKML